MNSVNGPHNDGLPIPMEIEKLTRIEQRYALPVYVRLMNRYTAARPENPGDNHNRALSSAYAQASRWWLLPGVFLALPGAMLGGSGVVVPAVVLLCISGGLFCMTMYRLLQALHFFPHFVSSYGMKDSLAALDSQDFGQPDGQE